MTDSSTRAAVLAAALLGLFGCADGGPHPQDITGSVTLDKEPVERGIIRFEPKGGTTPTAEALIEAGRYAMPVMPGTYKVEIRAPRTTKRKRDIAGPGQEADVTVESIPARYNNETTLEVIITKDNKVYDFPLTTKP